MKHLITIALLGLALIACERRRCIRSHTETTTVIVPMYFGNDTWIYMPQTQVVSVCDEYEAHDAGVE